MPKYTVLQNNVSLYSNLTKKKKIEVILLKDDVVELVHRKLRNDEYWHELVLSGENTGGYINWSKHHKKFSEWKYIQLPDKCIIFKQPDFKSPVITKIKGNAPAYIINTSSNSYFFKILYNEKIEGYISQSEQIKSYNFSQEIQRGIMVSFFTSLFIVFPYISSLNQKYEELKLLST